MTPEKSAVKKSRLPQISGKKSSSNWATRSKASPASEGEKAW
jgi:hypothetical protein